MRQPTQGHAIIMDAELAGELDRVSDGTSWVHARDPRAKLIFTCVFLLIVASFQKHVVLWLLPLAIWPAILAYVADIRGQLLFRGLLVAMPFAMLAGLFNPLLDRIPVALLPGVLVSGGWLSFLSIVIRCALAVSMGLVLAATTPLPRLSKALRRLGIPALLAETLLLLHRYLLVLVAEAVCLERSRALRAPRRRRARLANIGPMLGSLLARSLDRAERVYRCMKVRGFHGNLPVLEETSWSKRDSLLLFAGCVSCLAIRWLAA